MHLTETSVVYFLLWSFHPEMWKCLENQCNPLQNIHGREQQQHKKMRKLVKLYVCVREHCHWCCFYSVEFWLFAWLNFCLLLSPSLSVSVTVTVLVQIIAKRYSIVQTVVFFFSHTKFNAASCAIIMMVFNTCFLVVSSQEIFFINKSALIAQFSAQRAIINQTVGCIMLFLFNKKNNNNNLQIVSYDWCCCIHLKHPVVPLNLVVNWKLSLR